MVIVWNATRNSQNNEENRGCVSQMSAVCQKSTMCRVSLKCQCSVVSHNLKKLPVNLHQNKFLFKPVANRIESKVKQIE